MTLLHVMEAPHERAGQHTTDVLDWELSRQEASAYLERLEEHCLEALRSEVEVRLEQGHPAERIAAVARELGADLTVLGSHGEHGATEWSLGSTAQQVLAVTLRSVLIVRSRGEVSDGGPPKRLLVPLDGSRRTESVLPTVTRIARAHGAELLLVFVAPEPVVTAVLSSPGDLEVARDLTSRLEESGREYLADLGDHLMREGAAVRTLVLRSADAKQTLLELSEREPSDLIVVSAHGATCNPALPFGGVTSHLVTHSLASILVLQDLVEREGERTTSGRAPPLRATYPEGV